MQSAKYPVTVVTEGLTEWRLAHALYKRKILDDSSMERPSKEDNTPPRQGYHNALNRLLSKENHAGLLENYRKGPFARRVLVIVDQERLDAPNERAADIERHFQEFGKRNHVEFWEKFSFRSLGDHENLFVHSSKKMELALHVSDAPGPGGNRDFDGYVLQLLQGPEKNAIAANLVKDERLAGKLLRKAEEEMPALMADNGFPIASSKAWIYIYIAAFQQRKSLVGFAETVVGKAVEGSLKEVFAPLIAAWNALQQRSFQ